MRKDLEKGGQRKKNRREVLKERLMSKDSGMFGEMKKQSRGGKKKLT